MPSVSVILQRSVVAAERVAAEPSSSNFHPVSPARCHRPVSSSLTRDPLAPASETVIDSDSPFQHQSPVAAGVLPPSSAEQEV
ncbi:hypothetical protein GCM10029992_35820 [Glycomyces albus]